MYVALPLDHPLATQRTVALKDLASDPLMLLSAPGASPDDNLIVLAFRAAGVEPTIAHLYDDHFAVEGLVASGMGIALLPGLALASTRTDIAVRPVRGTPPRRRVVAITVDPPPPATQAMLDALRTAASTQPSPAG
jgi:DNA-binding transcriptional LysR family regulator